MAMKKKLAVGIGAALITAMCFGGSVFAESIPVNGEGEEANSNGSTEAIVTFQQAGEDTPTWSVNIPKEVNFGTVNAAFTPGKQDLEYSANIKNPENAATKIESLEIKLDGGPSYDMTSETDSTLTADKAFSIQNRLGEELQSNGVIANLTSGSKATAKAALNVDVFDKLDLGEGSHAFSGKFGVVITPVKEGN